MVNVTFPSRDQLLRGIGPAVFFAILAHRLWLIGHYQSDLTAFFLDQGDLQIFHYLPVGLLQTHPWRALLYLQQSPPLPSLIFSLFCQLDWPLQVAWSLVALNGLFDALTAGLLASLIQRIWNRPGWALGLGLIFGLSSDLVIMDYNVRGQSFYENLAMLLVLLVCRLLLAWLEHDDLGPAWALGLVAAALALTRASYSYFSLFLLALLLVLPWERKRQRILAFATAAFLLQGGWSLKNYWVFGEWRWTTSTWGGANLTAGLVHLGYGPDLQQQILAHPERYPAFFVELVQRRIDFGFHLPAHEASLPAELIRQDRWLDAQLLHQNRFQNAVSQRVAYDHLAKAGLSLVLSRPEILVRKLKWSYKLYWFPIRYHPGQYFFRSPWVAEGEFSPSLVPWRLMAALLPGGPPETTWLIRGTQPTLLRRPAELWTLDRLNLVVWQLNLWLIHGLALPWALVLVWRRLRRAQLTHHGLLHGLFAAVFFYAALLHNLVEFGENMRFRLNAEPVIWLLSFSAAMALWTYLGAARKNRAAPTGS